MGSLSYLPRHYTLRVSKSFEERSIHNRHFCDSVVTSSRLGVLLAAVHRGKQGVSNSRGVTCDIISGIEWSLRAVRLFLRALDCKTVVFFANASNGPYLNERSGASVKTARENRALHTRGSL